MSKYKVLVDDNFHYMDASERYEYGIYKTIDEAKEVCKNIVDQFLIESYEPGITAGELYLRYVCQGEDPWIMPPKNEMMPGTLFSAWKYAEQKCKEICVNN